MSFIDERFPTDFAYGRVGGPERNTRIARSAAGYEQRQALFANALRVYDVSWGIQDLDDLLLVTRFHEAMEGRTHSFPFKDHADFKSCDPLQDISAGDVEIGTGDSAGTTEFPLVKPYTIGSQTVERPIVLPIVDTVRIAFDDVEQLSGFSVSRPGGVVTFSVAPDPGVVVTAGFEFDVEVRFDADYLPTSLDYHERGNIDGILLREVPR